METKRIGGALARLVITLLFLLTCDSDGSAGDNATYSDANGTKLFTHEKPRGSEKPDSRAWKEIVGRNVVVQGLFWGTFEKGYGPYVIMNGSVIYIDSKKLPAVKIQGRLVELKGKLVVRYQPAGRKNSAGNSRPVRIFKVQPTQYRLLRRVDWPWMRLEN
jgi:hypothetical protein